MDAYLWGIDFGLVLVFLGFAARAARRRWHQFQSARIGRRQSALLDAKLAAQRVEHSPELGAPIASGPIVLAVGRGTERCAADFIRRQAVSFWRLDDADAAAVVAASRGLVSRAMVSLYREAVCRYGHAWREAGSPPIGLVVTRYPSHLVVEVSVPIEHLSDLNLMSASLPVLSGIDPLMIDGRTWGHRVWAAFRFREVPMGDRCQVIRDGI